MRWLGLALALLAASAAAAQETTAEDFEAQARAAAPEAGDDFGLIRCAALFRSLAMALGPDMLGPERMAGLADIERRFGVAAVLIRAEATGNPDREAVISAILDDIEAIAPLYLARYLENRELRGNAWSGDPMLKGDQEFCTGLLETMQ